MLSMSTHDSTLAFGERHESLSSLDELADGMASTLQRRGVQRGQRVALMSSNRPEFVVAVRLLMPSETIPCSPG
jgi:long-chain acyl-CoA synthetase